MKCKYHLCDKDLTGKQRAFCGVKCKNKYHVTESRRRRKRMLVDHLGGKCSRCGYSKSFAALQFHHHDNNKEFGISAAGHTKSWLVMLEEASKCELICANCHAEEHGTQ